MATDQEQTIRLLTRTLVHAGEVLAQLTHPLLSQALRDALESLLRAACAGGSDRGAILSSAGQLQRCLEDVSIVSGAPLTSLLLAERHVLLLQLHLGTERNHASRTPAAPYPAVSVPRTIVRQPQVSANLRASMEQVLRFVRTAGPSQARDIIAGCAPALSERTVKRRIRDLVSEGKLRKEEADGMLLYRATA